MSSTVPDSSDKTLLFIDSSCRLDAEDSFLTAQDRVRKWLDESSELKLPVNSGSESFRSMQDPTDIMFLSEEEAEMYPNKDGHYKFGGRQSCFRIFPCFPLKNKR
jgi:hypothetical protein